MPIPPSQNERLAIQETRTDEHERRLEKYDTIIEKLNEIVIDLKARSENSWRWIMLAGGIAAASIGAILSYILSHPR